jgi:hypothetical protein
MASEGKRTVRIDIDLWPLFFLACFGLIIWGSHLETQNKLEEMRIEKGVCNGAT